ncbi:MAG: 6-phosphogluconolactonase [Acidobacteriia bacterium]|nr:6-phosphogluconolactonase [Terriglobia bacterium]
MGGVSVVVLEDSRAVAEEAAKRVEAAARDAVAARGRFSLVLAGGSTPRALYAILASPHVRSVVPWRRTIVLFGDERCVPPDHPDSNFHAADESLLRHVPVLPGAVHRIVAEDPEPASAAARYEEELRGLFPGEEAPSFDLVLLGMGADGHTASLFPRTAALDETSRWVAVVRAPSPPVGRITLTLPALRGARRVLFQIVGADKAWTAAEVFGGLPHPSPYPAERVALQSGAVEVLLDEAAAGSGAFRAHR